MEAKIWNGIEVPYDATVQELKTLALGPAPACWAAFVALSQKPEAEALHILEDFARSPDSFVRRAAAEGLGRHPSGNQAVPALVACLQDSSEYVVRSACEAVAELRVDEAHEHVVRLVASSIEATRKAALRTLRSIWQEQDFALVFSVFRNDQSETVQNEAAWTMRDVAAETNWGPLFSLWAQDHRPRHRLWACEIAGSYGGPDVIPSLIELSKDTDGHVRRMALRAVDQVQSRTR